MRCHLCCCQFSRLPVRLDGRKAGEKGERLFPDEQNCLDSDSMRLRYGEYKTGPLFCPDNGFPIPGDMSFGRAQRLPRLMAAVKSVDLMQDIVTGLDN